MLNGGTLAKSAGAPHGTTPINWRPNSIAAVVFRKCKGGFGSGPRPSVWTTSRCNRPASDALRLRPVRRGAPDTNITVDDSPPAVHFDVKERHEALKSRRAAPGLHGAHRIDAARHARVGRKLAKKRHSGLTLRMCEWSSTTVAEVRTAAASMPRKTPPTTMATMPAATNNGASTVRSTDRR